MTAPERSIAPGVTIRPYAEGDDERINDGFNAAFGQTRSLEEWRWKFSAASGGSEILLALHEDTTLLSHYAAIRVRAKHGNRIVDAGQVVDSFSIAAHGAVERRVFIKLATRFLYQEYDGKVIPLMYGFPGERHLKLGRLKAGYEFIQPVVLHRRKLFRFDPRRRVEREMAPSGVELDELWEQSATRYHTCAIRDSSWIERRYLTRPGGGYTIITRRRQGRLQCWAVVRPDSSTMHWIDLLWNGEDPADLVALARQVAAVARREGTRHVDTWIATDPVAAGILESEGWVGITHPANIYLTIHPRDPKIDGSSTLGGFYYTMGDTDII